MVYLKYVNEGGMLLVINPGSSSVKAMAYDESELERALYSVSIEGIGTGKATLLPGAVFDENTIKYVDVPDYLTAVRLIREWFEKEVSEAVISAVGYRVVHGGDRYRKPTKINTDVIEYLRSISSLASNHMPGAIDCIKAFQAVYPEVVHVACFDTAFFSDIPQVSRTLPIPKGISKEGVRRYGFHGLSYEYLLESFRKHEGELAARGRVILAHMGNGVSLTACYDGRPIDTTMGFTPVSGVPMSTRTGDIEPGIIFYLMQEKGMTVEEVSDIVTKKSGLLGISDDTSDMYHLLQHQHENESSALAVEYFCYEIKKQMGAYIAILGGVDSIIFAGGIGERSAEIRARILEGLGFVGIVIDPERNNENARLISSNESSVGVHVISTHEDVVIAKQTMTVYEEGEAK